METGLGALLAGHALTIARIASAFLTIVPHASVSSASGLIAAGSPAHRETARRSAEPFVLPADDKPSPKAQAERRPAEPTDRGASASRPARADGSGRTADAPAEQPATDPAAEAGEAGPGSLVGLQEDALAFAEAEQLAEGTFEAAAGDLAAQDLAAGFAEAAGQQANGADVATQQAEASVAGEVAANAAAEKAGLMSVVEAEAQDAATTALQAQAAQLEKAVASGDDGADTISPAAGEAPKIDGAAPLVWAVDKPDLQIAKAGAEAAKAPAAADPTSEKSLAGAAETGLPPAGASAATDMKSDQPAAAPAGAKTELMAKLEQTFAQPLARPADIAAQLPLQAPPADVPRAIPPSAVPMEIGLRSLQGLKEFQIRLDPAELGRVDVTLEIGDDKSVTARVVVDRVETLHLLQREAKTLERAFEQAGLKSSDAGVDITLRDPGQQPGQGRREGQSEDGEAGHRDGRSGRAALAEMPVIPIRRTLHVGALDLSI
jgi:flagellar hook-length control protein FliK